MGNFADRRNLYLLTESRATGNSHVPCLTDTAFDSTGLYWGRGIALPTRCASRVALAITVRHRLTTNLDHYVIAAAVAIIVYGLLAELGDMYRSWRGVSAHREAVGTLIVLGIHRW